MIEINVPLGPIAYVKVSGDTSHQVLAQLTEVLNGEIPSTVGRLVNETDSANVGERLGRELGATQVDSEYAQQLQEDPRSQPIPQEDPISEFQQPSQETREAQALAFQPVPRDPAPHEQQAPGAPQVMGRKAFFASWSDESGDHGAFVHPFLYDQDWEKATADNNDPRLATGEAWYFMQSY